ncbi:hypothetical protein T069G_07790 [Trichoderma breve]|uniref:Apple domain-containing protein n=1 Tax=Trichoderma breve TaxID=2034170 RepID=A0A9W9E2V6_9HYPO|nr:hypothetical protein T069G_07790 [Trichoderma breve]KAJ4856893.1 hypothetical protein T069G_07790 [Trichoderma breve]
MKLITLSVALSVLNAVDARDPACHPPAPSCRWVSWWTARECNAIINARHIRRSTCEAPEGTVIRTSTVTRHPTITQTKTVKHATSTKTSTRTVTVTDPITHQDTATAWATLTAVATTTDVETDSSTVTITTTSVETDTSSTTVTTTQDSTSFLSWAPETCAQGPPTTTAQGPPPTLAPTFAPTMKRSENHYDELPRDCSCFLTSTKSCGPRVTKVVTKTKEDRPKIITKTVTDRNCKTVTTTKTSTTHVNGAPPPKKTVTLTTTSTSTTTATSTSTVKETTTATESTTTTVIAATTVTTGSTVTQTENPCDPTNISKYILQGPPSNPTVVLGFRGDGGGDLSNCCSNCLANNDCVFWKMSAGGSTCENYYTNRGVTVEGCTSAHCTRGHPVMNVDPNSDGNTYGMASCGQFQIVY